MVNIQQYIKSNRISFHLFSHSQTSKYSSMKSQIVDVSTFATRTSLALNFLRSMIRKTSPVQFKYLLHQNPLITMA